MSNLLLNKLLQCPSLCTCPFSWRQVEWILGCTVQTLQDPALTPPVARALAADSSQLQTLQALPSSDPHPVLHPSLEHKHPLPGPQTPLTPIWDIPASIPAQSSYEVCVVIQLLPLPVLPPSLPGRCCSQEPSPDNILHADLYLRDCFQRTQSNKICFWLEN